MRTLYWDRLGRLWIEMVWGMGLRLGYLRHFLRLSFLVELHYNSVSSYTKSYMYEKTLGGEAVLLVEWDVTK